MSKVQIIFLTIITMVAFAGNSLLCRLALDGYGMDPASFTSIRFVSGAVTLWLVVRLRPNTTKGRGNWLSAFMLFVYAACFSYAYVTLSAATGALLLFGAVQATMISHSLHIGERMGGRGFAGLSLALAGLVYLLWPGLSAPPLFGSLLMIASGIAWGLYSLRGRGTGDPTRTTADNFVYGIPFAAALSLVMVEQTDFYNLGIWSATASGAVTSGLGYALWYRVLPSLKTTDAATVQLSAPVIAAAGGVLFLAESMTLHLVMASVAILGGIGLVTSEKRTDYLRTKLND